MRRRIAALLPVLLIAGLGLTAAPAEAATSKRPVIFVHGWTGSPSSFATAKAVFRAGGYRDRDLFAWRYDSLQDNVITARQLARKVTDVRRRTGKAKVDIVTHSMGGLPTRYYIKHLGGARYVDEWVSLGGPNHGTDMAQYCQSRSCVDMRFGSAFLTRLNRGDETPGRVRYGTWWSPCDTVINPDTTVALAGARNTRTACLSHGQLLTNRTVLRQVRRFVA